MHLLQQAIAIAQNPTFSGIVAASAIGGAVWALREFPSSLWRGTLNFISREVRINNDTKAFEWVEHWLAQNPYTRSRWCRRLRLTIEPSKTIEHNDHDRVMSPGSGYHFIIYKKRLLRIERHMDDQGAPSLLSPKRVELFRIRAFFSRMGVIDNLVDDAEVAAKMVAGRIPLCVYASGWWQRAPAIRPRSIENVYLPGTTAQDVVDDAIRFLRSADWYASVGVPFRRGYLLQGPPGSGKTTLALALASALKRPIYVIPLATMDDTELSIATMSLPRNAILLLEDVDTVKQTSARRIPKVGDSDDESEDDSITDKDTKEVTKLTLGGLLNCLDGVFASEGRIVVLTTNFPEKLDPALVRPGRVDVTVDFTLANADITKKMFKAFFPDQNFAGDLFDSIKTISPAMVQGVLLKNRDNPVAAVGEVLREQRKLDNTIQDEQKEAA